MSELNHPSVLELKDY